MYNLLPARSYKALQKQKEKLKVCGIWFLEFSDNYPYLLYYFRLIIVSFIEDFSTMNRRLSFYKNNSDGGILVLCKVIPNLFRNLLMRS